MARLLFPSIIGLVSILSLQTVSGAPSWPYQAVRSDDSKAIQKTDGCPDVTDISSRLPRTQKEQTREDEAIVATYRDRLRNHMTEGIPGSKLFNPNDTKAFRAHLKCLTGSGSWHFNDTPRPLLKHVTDAQFVCAAAPSSTIPWSRVRKDLKYTWNPIEREQCNLRPINTQRWCDMMNGRDVFLVGDSVQYQLHDLLLDQFHTTTQSRHGETNCGGHALCQDTMPNLIKYVRNDHLTLIRANDHPVRTSNQAAIEHDWDTSLSRYGIIILNHAASTFSDDAFLHELSQTLLDLRKRYPQHLILYRNTPQVHPECDTSNKPLTINHASAIPQNRPKPWSNLHRQNRLAQLIVESIGGVYVDVATMTDMRPDGHLGNGDCVRYCIPGPIDNWLLVLYNVFLLLAEYA